MERVITLIPDKIDKTPILRVPDIHEAQNILRFVWYFYQVTMYQKSEWYFFDQGP